MQQQNNKNNKTITQREKETYCSQGLRRKIAGTLISVIHHPQLTEHLLKLKKYNTRALEQGDHVYQNYFFGGNNPFIQQFLQEKKKKPDLDHRSLFANIDLLEDIYTPATDNMVPAYKMNKKGIQFNHDPEGKKLMNEFVNVMTFHPERNINFGIDEKSRQHLYDSLMYAKSYNKKIVLLGNHSSNFDAPIYQFILEQLYESIAHKPIIRFFCGAYMYYHPSVSPFNVCFDTTLVFGKEDMTKILRYIMKTDYPHKKELCEKIIKQTQETFASNPEEITVLYPYAGREHNDPTGCKKEIPTSMKEYFYHDNIVYVPISIIGTKNNIKHHDRLYGMPFIKTFHPETPEVRIGKFFEAKDIKDNPLGYIDYTMKSISGQTLQAFHNRRKKT